MGAGSIHCRWCRVAYPVSSLDRYQRHIDGWELLVQHVYLEHPEHADQVGSWLGDMPLEEAFGDE